MSSGNESDNKGCVFFNDKNDGGFSGGSLAKCSPASSDNISYNKVSVFFDDKNDGDSSGGSLAE